MASFALALVVFGYYSFVVYALLIFVIVIVGGLVVVKRNKDEYENLFAYWKWKAANGGALYPLLLAFRSMLTEGKTNNILMFPLFSF